jgi:hypothetical protein
MTLKKQVCSLKNTKQQIEDYLVEAGYWGSQFLRDRNNFVLSPCAYNVSREQEQEIATMGKSIYAALGNVAEKIHNIAKGVPKNRSEQELIGIATRGSKKLLSPAETIDGLIPPVIKVDMVQDCEGRYYVIEVDAYNPRGLGFNALLENKALLNGERQNIIGTVDILSKMLLNFCPGGKFVYLVSEYERYYEPSFLVLQKELLKKDVEMVLIKESSFLEDKDMLELVLKDNSFCMFMIPESLDSVELREILMKGYKEGGIKYFFPPKAYLGSKLLLPYIKEQIGVNGYIPNTKLMSKYHDGNDLRIDLGWVLKAGQSSGMKGVLFSDSNKEAFEKCFIQESKKKRPSWVIQELIKQRSLPIQVFEGENLITKDYFLRIIAQFNQEGLIGLDITGRTDTMVHGAPDCIMLPAVLE